MPEKYTADSIIALAASIREQANGVILKALAERGVTDLLPAHGTVLHALFQQGPLPMGALARAIDRKKNTVTGLINTLEQRGYCRREPDPQDARVQRIALTARGESLRAVQAEISESLLRALWEGVSESEKEVCIRSLRKILHNLKNIEGERHDQ